MIPDWWADFYRDQICGEDMNKKPFPCKDVINKWMEDTTQILQIRVADSNSKWTDCRHQVPVLSDQFEYRIVDKPKPLGIKFPEFILPEFKYVAMDDNGTWFAYMEEPTIADGHWYNENGSSVMNLTIVVSMPAAPRRRWKETLIKRP